MGYLPVQIGEATAPYLTHVHTVYDEDTYLRFDSDLSHGTGRALPHGQSVGDTVDVLSRKMRVLLQFAHSDRTGMAERMFNHFLAGNTEVTYFEDDDLNRAAEYHPSTDQLVHSSLGHIYGHLLANNFDITMVPFSSQFAQVVFNRGSGWRKTEDHANGLTIMVDRVTTARVFIDQYSHEGNIWNIDLRFVLYDVFGLGDNDIETFGYRSQRGNLTRIHAGFTAWWQLQHQHNFAPMITKIEFTKRFQYLDKFRFQTSIQ